METPTPKPPDIVASVVKRCREEDAYDQGSIASFISTVTSFGGRGRESRYQCSDCYSKEPL